jgi:thioesterase domain-containing protein
VPLVILLDTYLTMADYEQQDLGDETMLRWIGGLLRIAVDELLSLSLERQWARISDQAAKTDGLGVPEVRRLAAVCRAHLRASAAYVAEPYGGRVVLLRAAESRGGFDPRWRPLCPALVCQTVPGNHYTMLRKPHVDVLAQRIGGCLSNPDGLAAR